MSDRDLTCKHCGEEINTPENDLKIMLSGISGEPPE